MPLIFLYDFVCYLYLIKTKVFIPQT